MSEAGEEADGPVLVFLSGWREHVCATFEIGL